MYTYIIVIHNITDTYNNIECPYVKSNGRRGREYYDNNHKKNTRQKFYTLSRGYYYPWYRPSLLTVF